MPRSTSTGFVINDAGYILTSCYSLSECGRITAGDSDVSLEVAAKDPLNDLALLKGPAGFMEPVHFRGGRSIRQGADIMVAGYPLRGLLASGINVSSGTVSALAGPGNDSRIIQFTAPVQPGNSGGPLLDSAGHVTGIVMASLDDLLVTEATGSVPQNVNFAIKSSVITSFLDTHGVNYETAVSTRTIKGTTLTRQAKEYTVLIKCW